LNTGLLAITTSFGGSVAIISLHDVRGVHFPKLTRLGLELLRRPVRLAALGGEIKIESSYRRWPLRANSGYSGADVGSQ
jgi:hypothetical protein